MQIDFFNSLSFRVLRSTFAWAMALGLLVSAITIGLDYRQVRQQFDKDMAALSNIILKPASAIVFSFDVERARELLEGTLSQPAIVSSLLRLENGVVFAEMARPLVNAEGRSLNDSLFGDVRHYEWRLKSPLETDAADLGALEIEVDTYPYGQVFLDRMINSLVSILAYALGISVMLLLIFYLQVTRPLNSVTRSIVTLGDKEHLDDRLTIPVGHERSEIGILVRTTNKHLDSIASMLDRLRLAEIKLTRYSDGLEATVAARTAELTASLTQLEAARDQLIQSEKMAALGGLVAGVAHEVNTPLGIAVTASSVLTEALQELNTSFEQQTLSERQFKQLVGQIAEGNELLSSNIHRAAKLISDFKKTAVDQISETLCAFKVKDTINALIASLHPETRRVPVTPEVICPEDLSIVGLPGVLSQILTNLIINSVRHAFENMEKPAEIRIVVSRSDDSVELEYIDNGAGVPAELHARVFEPFFTTKRGKGGSGLGLNIVYNLVTRKLQGTLEFHSELGQGVSFKLRFPARLTTS